MVTAVPAGPAFVLRLVMAGGTNVKRTPLEAIPLIVTTTLPVLTPFGTGTTIDVGPQVVGTAVVPLNFTVFDPCVLPKFVPVIVTGKPTVPELGLTVVM